MQLNLATAPAETPVTLAEAKLHLRVEHSADDTLISSLIAAATEQIDGRFGSLRRAVVTQTWDLFEVGFPVGRVWRFPLPPLQSIGFIKYYDANNAQQTFSASNYDVIITSFEGYVKLKPGMSWPAVYSRDDAVNVRFVAGFGAAAAVPASIKAAVLLMVGDLYSNRGDEMPSDANKTVERLLKPYRVVTVA